MNVRGGVSRDLVARVRDAIDIVDVASAHVQVEKRGERYWACCPFHKEKTPSFSIDPDRGLYYCFGCGAGGDAIRLHQQLNGEDFLEAIETLAGRFGFDVAATPDPEVRRHRRIDAVLAAAQGFFRRQLAANASVVDYLKRRALPEEISSRFGLGYAPESFEALLGALRREHRLEDLEAAGLVGRSPRSDRPYDRFRHRLMFPIHDGSGRLVGFGGRTLGDHRAKYINTADTPRFQKRQLLYGLHEAKRAIRQQGRLLLVEGYFDALAAVAHGVDWVVASMGTALSTEQTRLCERYAEEVVIGYDGDAAGREASRKATALLAARGLRVRRLQLEEGEHPDSLCRRGGASLFAERIEAAPDALRQQIEEVLATARVDDPSSQSQTADGVQRLLEPVRDPVLRFTYQRLAAERLGLPVELLARRATTRGAPEARDQSTAPQVISLEEKVLRLLLLAEDEELALAGLPEARIFLDPVNRNIFEVFRGLRQQQGVAPSEKDLLAALPREDATLDRAALLLLEGPSGSGVGELRNSLDQLKRRWQQRRLRTLAREIKSAQQRGEGPLLRQLIEEKTTLSRSLHQL